MLVLDHFGAMSLPGCGAGSGCAAAAKSAWAHIGVVPVAFLGLAWFVALVVSLIASRGAFSSPARLCVRIAAGVSLVYVGIAAGANLWCVYCLVVHACNVLIFILQEGGVKATGASSRPLVLGAGVALACLAVLAPIELIAKRDSQAKAEEQLAASTAKMTQRAAAQTQSKPTEPTPTKSTATPTTPSNAAEPTKAPASSEAAPPATPEAVRPLAGRYRFGPEKASVRIVMFTDYQCPDCYKVEEELSSLMKSTPSLSVGIKYFPLSNKCNPAMGDSDMHPNACWAARAAETAGLLKGPEGFWEMHHWLFSRRGSFTDAELAAGLSQLGYDRKTFESIMTGAQTGAAVKSDVDEGASLGIFFTPMIFINGVELKGWNAPQALTRAVAAVVASGAAPAANSADVPPTARERYFNDWREQPVTEMPDRFARHTISPSDAEVSVVLIGDYQEKNTADADGLLRLFTQGPKPHVRYSYVQFPINKNCNPSTQLVKNLQACDAARAAEAAEVIGGDELFWRMHDWLMSHQNGVTKESLATACPELGMDAETLETAMEQPFTAQAIADDAKAAIALGMDSVPRIYINGKRVPRWKLNNENLLAAMILEAAQK
ncbi:MAG: DsbA family protein [Planctomycetes bacterium]|nr:DsbA family protein [Planctomycetota bacterium]